MSNQPGADICSLPWVELHVTPYGTVKNCCAQVVEKFGEVDVKQGFLKQFNSEFFVETRQSFLNNEIPQSCLRCHQNSLTGTSYKTVKSHQWMNEAESAIKEGKTQALKIKFLDIRFSNTCNFACRTCDSDNSSRWEKLDEIVGRSQNTAVLAKRSHNAELLNSVIEIAADLKEIYFAGGEPLIIKEHYLLLERLIETGNTNIKLTYNTNLSHLDKFGFDLTQLWNRFDKVELYPSIDSIGEAGEYIREGFSWPVFEKNFAKVKKYVSSLQIVLSAYNIFSIVDLLKWAIKEDVPFSITIAYFPYEISLSCLPAELLAVAREQFKALADTLALDSIARQKITTTAELTRNVHFSSENAEKFLQLNTKLDQHFQKSYRDVFTEESHFFKITSI